MKAKVRHSGALDDVVRWGDIDMFRPDNPVGWWDVEYAKGNMWFPGAVRTACSPGPPFDWAHVEPNNYVTRDAAGNLYVWDPKSFGQVYELLVAA